VKLFVEMTGRHAGSHAQERGALSETDNEAFYTQCQQPKPEAETGERAGACVCAEGKEPKQAVRQREAESRESRQVGRQRHGGGRESAGESEPEKNVSDRKRHRCRKSQSLTERKDRESR